MTWPSLIAPPQHDNPAPGWEDPKLPDIRLIWKLARECGYAVGVHGSLKRDFDLIAVPWVEDAVSSAKLVSHLCDGLDADFTGCMRKPFGRIGVTIQVNGWFKVIDLSIIPRNIE